MTKYAKRTFKTLRVLNSLQKPGQEGLKAPRVDLANTRFPRWPHKKSEINNLDKHFATFVFHSNAVLRTATNAWRS